MTTGDLFSEFVTTGNNVVMKLKGVMDEESVYPEIPAIKSGSLTIDLHQVTRCNSTGILRWVQFLKRLPGGLPIRLVQCPSILVRLFNLFASILDHAGLEVESFFVGFTCEKCETGRDVLILKNDIQVTDGKLSVKFPQCATCGTAMELDNWPEKQFLFLLRGAAKI